MITRWSASVAYAIWPGTISATPGIDAIEASKSFGRIGAVGYTPGPDELTYSPASPSDEKLAFVESMALALAPVLCTVIDTAISTVIKVAHTRRGARSMVAAASAPDAPKTRATAAATATIGPAKAKHTAISPAAASPMAATDTLPRSRDATRAAAATRPTPTTPTTALALRGTASATEAPTGASASTGATLYTWRAAKIAAATLTTTHAATATGIA